VIRREKTFNAYQEAYDHSRRWREQEGLDSEWRRYINLYRGEHFRGSSTEDRIAVNIAKSTVDVMEPAVAINYPKIQIEASKPQDQDRASIAEDLLNYWWRHYDLRVPTRLATKDALVVGHGWNKTSWRFVEGEIEQTPEQIDQLVAERIGQADAYSALFPHLADKIPTDEEIYQFTSGTLSVALEDRPYVERISPFNMFVSPEATSMQDLRWIAQRLIKPIKEVKNNKLYSAKTRADLQPTLTQSTADDSRERDKRRTGEQFVEIIEFYDLDAGEMAVFSAGSDRWLLSPQDMPYAFGHPFVFLGNYQVPEQFYPMGEIEPIEDLQQELNKTRSQMMNYRKRWARSYFLREDHVSETSLDDLQSGKDGVLVRVNTDLPFKEIMAPVDQTQMPSDAFAYSDIITQDMNTVTGVSEYARGGASANIRRTATEAALIQDSQNARSSDKLDRVEQFISATARKVLQLAQQYMTAPEVARVTGEQGGKTWVEISNEDIQGEFDFQVEAGSTQPDNEAFRRQTAQTMAAALAPFVGVVIDPTAMAVELLKKGFGIKDPERFLMQQAPPMPPGGDPSQMGADPTAAGGMPGMPGGMPVGPDAQGADAPQLDPQILLAMQQAGGSDVAGLPPELTSQLQAQMGIL
jgi:hypothetical protein